MRDRYKILAPVILAVILYPCQMLAYEGMWLPTLLKSIEGDMRTAGLQITAEDIYSINNGSIKDAVVLFGGGCTAEVIGAQGLIFTNHHCGFGAIAEHSSLENDRLKNGFWARDGRSDLRNPGLTATFVVRMEDVTEKVLAGIPEGSTEAQRREAVARIADPIIQEATQGTHYRGTVRPFNYGNTYILIITETFRDVRLVGAPPSSIGKFGGDADNWMWPRHTGDFAMFRIYAAPDNTPADPSDANVPFTPRHVLPISLSGVQEGDFAMIFGFPGNTQQYLASYAIEYIQDKSDPTRIRMREASLAVIDDAMRSSDLLRLHYADKQSTISNAYKKWIGELRGLRRLNTLEEKRAFEKRFTDEALRQNMDDAATIIRELEELYQQYTPYALARDLFVEMVYYGPDILRFADRYRALLDEYDTLEAQGKSAAAVEDLRAANAQFFKDHDMEVDRGVFKALLPIYREQLETSLAPDVLEEIDRRFKGDVGAWVDELYERSVFTSQQRLDQELARFNKRSMRQLKEDPVYRTARSFTNSFTDKVRPVHLELSDRLESIMRRYLQARMRLFPEREYWPDANSTLRLSYGHVEGSEPWDAVVYQERTTLEGVMDKYVPGDELFDVPERLRELFEKKDYGEYGDQGVLPVCFTSSLHTTGGNSGSPVLNGRGELIGINFDRTWESTMSDLHFDAEICRNISVDIRYVLFIVDKFAGAGHLLQEMHLVRSEAPVPIDLPIHR